MTYDDDPSTPASLTDAYRQWTTDYLKQVLGEFQAAEVWNRIRRDAIERVLAERHETTPS